MSDTFMAFVEETARAAEKRGEERGKSRTGERFAIRMIVGGCPEALTTMVTCLPGESIRRLHQLVTAGLDEEAIMDELHPEDARRKRKAAFAF